MSYLYFMKIINRIRCFLGLHDWKNIDNTQMPDIPKGGSLTYCELHQCSKCKKEEYLGMGTII